MNEKIPQVRHKHTGRIIVLSILGLFILLATFTIGFVTGAWFLIRDNPDLFYGGDTYYFDQNIDNGGGGDVRTLKPAIYLYPTTTLSATVRLDYDGEITTDIPVYDHLLGGWKVTAEPDGTLTAADDKQYPYLFWEGKPNVLDRYDNPTSGFVVPGKDTETFLRTTLPRLGLIASEYEEFIEYWVPKLEHNRYTLIHFAGADYAAEAQLSVSPQPDSMVRVFMVTKALETPMRIKPQILITPQRTGFTVVEWGGTILY